jgi:hypothetical protein
MFSRRQFLIGSSAVLAAGICRKSWAFAAEDLAAAREQLYGAYAERLATLAAWCDEQHLADESTRARSWLPDRTADRQYLYAPGQSRASAREAVATTVAAPGTPAAEFAERFGALRREQAGLLLALAKRAASDHQAALVGQLVSEAAREDVASEKAWRLLGYSQYAGAWHTPFEIQQLKAGKVWHDRFGWLPRDQVARYERGERFFRGRWMSDREEARQRAEIRNGWRVETDHFLVTTNVGLEEAVKLAEQLERLRALWQQVFAGYLVDEAELPKLLASGNPLVGQSGTKQNVVFYRNRKEYNDALRAVQPQIEMTLGIYLDTARIAYFFADVKQEPGTLFHEATHQLFQESRPVTKTVGASDNFWIVEAMACYMESLVERDDYYTLGGRDAGRMSDARHRRLRDGFYMPLEQLVRLGQHDLHQHADIAKLYTQSAGLGTFLMDRHPQATTAYIKAVYAGCADVDTLARLTGSSYADLDREYGEYLKALED